MDRGVANLGSSKGLRPCNVDLRSCKASALELYLDHHSLFVSHVIIGKG